MGLSGQLAQGHFGAFAGIALGAESGIAQTRATVFTALTKPVIAAIVPALKACTGAAVATTLARADVAAARLACSGRFGFLLTRTVVATHGHHRTGRLGYGCRCSGFGGHLGRGFAL
jgi:hypothetical protein